MTATMKGLLKGLRYISQIFDTSDEDVPEMQIGNPTDVKHVAHIGWDGPSVNSPSWMNDFRSPNASSSAPLNFPQAENENSITRRHSEDVYAQDAPELPMPRRYSSMEPPSPEPEERKQSRRRHSAGGSINSPGRDLINGLKPRRHQHHSSIEVDSSLNNAPSPPSIPKKSRKKKSKEKESSAGGVTDGSSKSNGSSSNGLSKSRLKGRKNAEPNSVTAELRPNLNDNDGPTSVSKALGLDEKKGYAGIPREELDL